MIVVDLFCGLGGFSKAFSDRGHSVIGVDIVPPADVLADVRALPFNGKLKPDVVLASPPCQEFSKYAMRHIRWQGDDYDIEKGMDLVKATSAAIKALSPRWHVIENVRGARKWFKPLLGEATQRIGSRYMWGLYPVLLMGDYKEPPKWGPGGDKDDAWKRSPYTGDDMAMAAGLGKGREARARLRSKIPYEISLRLCEAMERGT